MILERIWRAGVATLHAAPGAGKTIFVGAVFQHLFARGLVDRLLVVVPNLALVDQWARHLGSMRIHIDYEPRDGVLEHPNTTGAVVTYQSLPGTASAQAVRFNQIPTLVVLDEVHHIAERASWGNAAREMLGDVARGDVHPQAVLNMTGTLFRSDASKRIGTVRYERVEADDGEQFEAIADWSVTTADLVGKELRPPDLYAYGSEAELVDIREGVVIRGDIADLGSNERRAVMREMYKEETWLRGYTTEALRMLRNAELALDDTSLKLLYVASDQRAAKMAADMINDVCGRNFARLIISDEPGALRTLKRAVESNQSCAIVAVQMVTEGFDCPEVAVIAYASKITAPLFVAQTMARAMRITALERAAGRTLPAQILIPDNPELRDAFASALASALHHVRDDEDAMARTRTTDSTPRLPRFELLTLSDPRLDSATVLGQDDGEVAGGELQKALPELENLGIPQAYAPRTIVFARRHRPPIKRYVSEEIPGTEAAATGGTVTSVRDPRAINKSVRRKIRKSAGWMSGHIDHDERFDNIGHFQALANDRAGIRSGGRDQATVEQLETCFEWMCDQVVEHCEQHEEGVPTWAE